MSKDITIIIPTHNRPRQLKRLLDYYSNYKIPIIVGDSTLKPFTEWRKFKFVKYFHYPNYSYAKKLPLIYKKVKTKYVLFCADDDFIIAKSVLNCVNFLNKHPDYNSAHGHYVFFESNRKNLSVYPFYLSSIDLDINSKSPSERVTHLLSNYMQLLYAVTRTADIKQIFKLLEKNPTIKNDNLVELFQAIILCINGKSKTLPILYDAREVTPNSARTYTKDLDIYFRKPEHFREYQAWSKTIIKHLSKREKILPDQAKEIFDKAVREYLKKSLLYIQVLKISILSIQRFANKYSFGLTKIIYDIIRSPKKQHDIQKHAFSKKEGKRDFEKIQKYIEKYSI